MPREPLPYVVADVFTSTPLEGNQLGVFTDARRLSAEQMQRLAREMNFAECTFVLPPEQGGDARIRIFTPAKELPFAGHPVLGTAFVVGEQKKLDVVRLETGMFAPALGVNEDPATGSAAGPLAIHLARHGRIAFGDEIEIRQGVELRRPSTLFARAIGTRDKIERVEVGGSAVVVARGEFNNC